MSEIDYLFEDTMVPEGQKYASISFLYDCNDKKKFIAVRVNGVYNTVDETVAECKKIVEPNTITILGEVGKWLSINPDVKKMNDTNSVNELNNIMMKRILNEKKKDKEYNIRKNKMIRDNLIENIKLKNEVLQQKDVTESVVESVKEQIKKMEDKKAELDKQIMSLEC